MKTERKETWKTTHPKRVRLAFLLQCALFALTVTGSAYAQETDPVLLESEAAQRKPEITTDLANKARVETKNRESIVLDAITVLGTAPERYNADSTSVGRIEQDLIKVPRSIVVIPEQILLDRQVSTFTEALANVGGVTEGHGFGGTTADFYMRGFRRNSIFRNGVRMSFLNNPPTQNIERIEVIKGPASVLYGQIEPGGLVNIITKKPTFQNRKFAQLIFDEYGKRLTTLDMTGPLDKKQTLAYRFNGSYEQSDTFRDFYEIERLFLSPSLHWNLSEDTALTFTYEHFKDNRPLDRGFVSLPNADGSDGRFIPDNIPVSRRFGEAFEERDSVVDLVELSFEHHFAGSWRASTNLLYRTEKSFDVQARPRSVDTDGNLTRRVSGSTDRDTNTYNINAQIDGSFHTGPLEHQLVIGVDYRDEEENRFFENGPEDSFNIFNPVYGMLTDTRTSRGDPAGREETAFGIYVQNQISLAEKYSLLLGGRYDETEGESYFADNVTLITKQTVFTPQAGILYQPTPATSLYFSYSEGFDPNTRVDELTGETFAPEEAEQFEVGAKGVFLDGKLNTTIALYDLTKTNIVESNVLGELALVGEVRSRGVEINATGEPLPGLNFISSYAYTDNEILGEFNPNRGNRTQNVAKHTLRFWASYEAHAGRFAGLGGGAGANYTSDRFGDASNTWSLGSYTLIDLALWYYLPVNMGLDNKSEIRFGMNVKNLTDERYFPTAGNALRIKVGQPRTVSASVALMF